MKFKEDVTSLLVFYNALLVVLLALLLDYITKCDFNNNLKPFCDWVQPCEGDRGDWIRSKHATPTPGTGPDNDHPDGSKNRCTVAPLSLYSTALLH